MNFQTPSGPRDEASRVYNSVFQDADTGFVGVDELTPPQQLAPGWVARAKNKRFRAGRATDRGGILLCRWMKGDGTTPFTEIYGAAVYSNPVQAAEWILMAADGGVWKTRPGNVARPVPLPPGVVLTADTFAMFVQCMNVLVLFRGPANPPLVCTDLDAGFGPIVQTTDGDGTQPIPNSSFGTYGPMVNRLLVVQGKDFLAASDIGDYTRYVEVIQTFQINQGDSDELIGVYTLSDATLTCLKSRSVYVVLNVTADLTTATGPYCLTREFGIVARRTAVQRGSNLYWLAQAGVVSIKLTELNQEQATTQALTDNLPVTFGRMNSLYAAGACAEIWNNRLYLALPLDDATFTKPDGTLLTGVNNGVIVYDFVNNAWCGSDEADGVVCVKQFLRLTYNGREHLIAVCADGWLREWEGGWNPNTAAGFSEDEIVTLAGDIITQPIQSDLTTRAFRCLDDDGKRFVELLAVASTWDPSYTITTMVNGANQENPYLQNVTKDRTLYDVADKDAYDPSNAHDDFFASKRLDYSVAPAGINDEIDPGVNGLVTEIAQDTSERIPIDERGYWMQVRFQNSRGSHELKLLMMETLRGDRDAGAHV